MQLKAKPFPIHVPGLGRHTGMSKKKPDKSSRGVYIRNQAPLSREDEALWHYIHCDLIDELAIPIIEDALNEHLAQIHKFLNDYVVARTRKKYLPKVPCREGC